MLGFRSICADREPLSGTVAAPMRRASLLLRDSISLMLRATVLRLRNMVCRCGLDAHGVHWRADCCHRLTQELIGDGQLGITNSIMWKPCLKQLIEPIVCASRAGRMRCCADCRCYHHYLTLNDYM